MKIILKGRIPSKKNQKIIVCRGRYPLLLPSKNHQIWHEEKSWELKIQKVSRIENIKSVEMIFFVPDNRKADLSNKAESLMDLLVDNGILEDDNCFVVPKLILSLGGVDKENPRVEINIE